jgi:hypothetical protein
MDGDRKKRRPVAHKRTPGLERPSGKGTGESEIRYSLTIKDLPANERPRERLAHFGAENLSTSELIAIILRNGVQSWTVTQMAEEIIKSFGGLEGLDRASISDLCANATAWAWLKRSN